MNETTQPNGAEPRPPSLAERVEQQYRAVEAHRAACQKQRKEFRSRLFGTDDPVAVLAPQSVEDYDALLGEHAAQLRNAVRRAMEEAVSDDVDARSRAPLLAALTRMVQTNLAIARKLKPSAN